MQSRLVPPIPYPPISRHALVGDRRCAALIAADGTVDWLCLPDYDGRMAFAALLDARRGGHWRFGPATRAFGEQRYVGASAVVQTRWHLDEGELELTDFMPWSDDEATLVPHERALLRRLRCTAGSVVCALDWQPGRQLEGELPKSLRLETSFPVLDGKARFALAPGRDLWATLAQGDHAPWDDASAARALDDTLAAWARWRTRLSWPGLDDERALRSALTIHLLGYAPAGSLVAAPTCSLPERVGGDRNYDYRYSWIRDASLCVSRFCMLGDVTTAARFLSWVAGLGSSTSSPLQVVYGIRGERELEERELEALDGYRESKPVHAGNRAYAQKQHGSLGFLADAMLDLVERGGDWRPEYAVLLGQIADHTCDVWEAKDSGIWELPDPQHYVVSKVMCWVTVDRALAIADRRADVASAEQRERWAEVRARIHAQVLERGYSEAMGAFREHYGSDELDAATLLIPIMGFLPASDPRVRSTIERLVERLSIGGYLHRWDSALAPRRELPTGQLEGAFIPLTFWLATALAADGKLAEAEEALARGEAAANELGLFSEEVDARDGSALGNFPLLFSHSEHLRAKMAIYPRDSPDLTRARAGLPHA